MTKPLRAILPSMIAFVATVVAWTTNVTCAGLDAALRERALAACMNPSEGSAGVVSTFAIATAPVSSSIRVASVNVPPMSIARRTLTRHRLLSSVVAVHGRRRAVGSTTRYSSRARSTADLALEHVAQDALGVALPGGP